MSLLTIDPEHVIPTPLNVFVSLIKSTINAGVILVPAYKAFKALQSNKLQPCQRMLVYFCAVTFINALREIVNEMAGKYTTHTIYILLTFSLYTDT